MTDQDIEQAAVEFAKKNRTRLARELTDPALFPPEDQPVSVFMAGSPGAGKTEASVELITSRGGAVLRIDPDEIRERIPAYTGANASLFQAAVIRIVEAVLDKAYRQNQSFILDGTFASHTVAERNIARALKRGRVVQVLYVYQEPKQAWRFVRAREAAEGRRIEPETFVEQYFAAREVVNAMKRKFGHDLAVDLLMKNNDGTNRFFRAGVDLIDKHIPEKYSPSDVRQFIGTE